MKAARIQGQSSGERERAAQSRNPRQLQRAALRHSGERQSVLSHEEGIKKSTLSSPEGWEKCLLLPPSPGNLKIHGAWGKVHGGSCLSHGE